MSCDGRRSLRRSDLLLQDGVIAALGGVDAQNALITETSAIVMPALVNAHVHLEEALLDRRFVPESDPWTYRHVQLQGWLRGQKDSDVRRSADAAFSRGLVAGTGVYGDASPQGSRMAAVEGAEAYGARLVIGLEASKDIAAEVEVVTSMLAERELAGLVSVSIWAGDAERTSQAKLTAAARAANTHQIPMVVQIGTMPGDSGGLKRLERAGAMNRHLVLCHGCGESLRGAGRSLAQAGASVVLTPAHDLLVGAPPPPVLELLDEDVNLALGSVSGATRTGYDLFRDARLLHSMLEGHIEQPASTVLEIATSNGAKALGLSAGTVEVGHAADLISIDVTVGDGDDHETVAERIVELGGDERIRNLWIAGRIAAKDGRLIQAEPPSRESEYAQRKRMEAAANVHSVGHWSAVVRAGIRRAAASQRDWFAGRLDLE